jgi:FKBP12-rapamycin complex-associated protein
MQIMDSMRQHSARLVEQADIVSHELIRVAVLWHELWHEGLEEASRLYFGDRNIEGMFATLAPLHDMLDQGPETLREVSHLPRLSVVICKKLVNGASLTDNQEMLGTSTKLGIYITKCSEELLDNFHSSITLELAYVSPKLLQCSRS